MAKRLDRAGLPRLPRCVPTLDTFKVGVEGPARKFRTQAELSRGKNHAQKTMTTHESLLSLAADSGADANKNHNNQPCKHFHTCLGRVSLHFWVDWAAVALTVSLLIRGPFSRTRTQVDCFDLCFLMQWHANQAETFACVAQWCRPASGTPMSCLASVQRPGAGVTMMSFVREKKWTDVGLSVIRQRERS